MAEPGPLLLFDGTCHFCNGAVQFVVDHEDGDALRFAPLQSELARNLLRERLGELPADFDTVVLVEGGQVFTYSDAALRIARYLRAPWRWASLFRVVPRPVRDYCYRAFARRRYALFGRSEVCRVPPPELRARFLG